uniref:Uncharacterized protein n=1 Tax=Chrysemys picta bellii TaxID=8478 RepID=A0A8C3EYT4_CHRPI
MSLLKGTWTFPQDARKRIVLHGMPAREGHEALSVLKLRAHLVANSRNKRVTGTWLARKELSGCQGGLQSWKGCSW